MKKLSLRVFPGVLPVVGILLLVSGCTERALLEVDSETAPGQSTPTVEIEIPVDGMVSWRDTTYWGYVTPYSSVWRVVADSADLQARLLARFETIPDSIDIASVNVPIESYANGRFRFIVDTASSFVPTAGLDLEVYSLARPYSERDATWFRAEEGDPWVTPGGDLDARIGSLRIDAPFDSTTSDTLFVPFELSTDSVLAAWAESDGEPGLAVRASGTEALLDIRSLAVVFEVKPEGQDSLVPAARSPAGYTVIFDPPSPPPDQSSRLGGLPASRVYLDFKLPETWEGIQLKGSTINVAALVFRPWPPEPIPFRLERPLEVVPFRLLADPFELGEKTPIGRALGPSTLLDPETITDDGAELMLNITSLIFTWSAAPEDSLDVLRVGVQVLPEGRDPGYWSFGSAEDAPGLRPSVRMLVTPRVPFRLP